MGRFEAESTSTMNVLGTTFPGAAAPPFKLDGGNLAAKPELARTTDNSRDQVEDFISTNARESAAQHQASPRICTASRPLRDRTDAFAHDSYTMRTCERVGYHDSSLEVL